MKAVLFVAAILSVALASEVITDDVISAVNGNPSSKWTASRNERFAGVHYETAKMMVGTELSKAEMTAATMPITAELPTGFDAREKWGKCIHPIRNQGQCGSCWAFGAAESVSDRFCIASNGQVDVVLSPQYLASCDFTDYGCNGGNLDNVWTYMKNYGLPEDSCDPYVSGTSGYVPSCPRKCKDGSDIKLYKVRNTYGVDGVDQIMNEIYTNGPVEAAFQVYQDFFSYKSGVYHHQYGSLMGGHAIKVLGWGVQEGTKYWLVANSWGPTWGLDGYFKIERGTNECGIESYVKGGMPKLDKEIQMEEDDMINSSDIVEKINNNDFGWTAKEHGRFAGQKLADAKCHLGAILPDAEIAKTNTRSLQAPSSFDWREKSDCVHAIRNQEQCGSCWAFGATEAFSDRLCLHNKVNVVLSAQNLVACDHSNNGCNGGRLQTAWGFMAESGVVADTCYPYTAGGGYSGTCQSYCTDGETWKPYYVDESTIQTFVGEESIKAEIFNNGPIEVSFAVYQDFFHYSGGVYSHQYGGLAGYHAVKIVGWGGDYWIVANSWGPSWGLDGYFHIKMGNNECGIESNGCAGIPKQ